VVKFLYILLITTFLNGSLFALEDDGNSVDCLILKDENSIICKYIQTRVSYDKTVTFEWISPNHELSRTRKLTIPAGHGSVYDYRYIKGRELGVWTFRTIDGDKSYLTTFEID
jgi:hypothetical protein